MPRTAKDKLGRRLKRGELEVATLSLTKTELEALPREHLSFYLQLGQLMNEIAMLQSLLLRSLNGMQRGPRPVQETALGMMLFLTRGLCGRLVEAHEAINSKANGRLLTALWAALPNSENAKAVRSSAESGRSRFNKELGQNSSLMRLVRNKLAYHLDAAVLMSTFDKVPESYNLADFHTGLRGTTFFGVADTVAALAVAEFTAVEDPADGIGAMATTALRAVHDLQDFADGFLLAFYLVHLGEARLTEAPQMTLKNLPELQSATLGFYMSSRRRTNGAS
jgi:hypothetical protein